VVELDPEAVRVAEENLQHGAVSIAGSGLRIYYYAELPENR
jgi:hypothetical protein